jgi:RNA polymerase sigma-70 factor (ECF subfamily)
MTTPSGGQVEVDGPEDSELVRRTLAGDREAFGDLVRRYERLVFRIVGGFLRNPADVDEVAQEVFVRAYVALNRFRLGSPFRPWVAQIATRASYDRLRRRRRSAEVAWGQLPPAEQRAAEELAGGTDPGDAAAARDLAERALACLKPKDRQVLVLADAQGFTAPEVARALGCSALAARLRLHRARRAMRRVVERLLAGSDLPR